MLACASGRIPYASTQRTVLLKGQRNVTKELEVYDTIPPSAMVIVAHPDDAEFMVAGTFTRWSRGGCRTVYVLVTDGDKGSSDPTIARAELAALRRAEQREACSIVGAQDVEFLHYEDGMVEPTLALRRDLARLIRKHKPHAVMVQDPARYFGGRGYVNHPDHRAVGEAALGAIYPTARDPLTFPELLADGFEPHKVKEVFISSGDDADVIVNISEALDNKVAALLAHKSQMGDWQPYETIAKWSGEAAKGHEFAHGETFKHLKLDD